MSWRKVDGVHSHCAKCAHVFRNIELTKGFCLTCRMSENSESLSKTEQALSRVSSKATKAATQFLSAMQSQGKSGASTPKIMARFLEGVGGEEGLGDMVVGEFKKAHGIGVTPEEAKRWGDTSPKLRMQWHELILRVMTKSDEGKVLDIGSLEEGDLESILANVGRKSLQEDPELRRSVLWAAIKDDKVFRRLAFYEIARQDKSLVDEFLREGGIITLDTTPETTEDTQEYDPTSDEYNG